jgi:hypothetical protein
MKTHTLILGVAIATAACNETARIVEPVDNGVILGATSPTSMTVVAGQAVPELPSVVAHDANGVARAGVLVTFTVKSGTIIIARLTAITDASGSARILEWNPGTKAGVTQTVTASALNSRPLEFTAKVVPGPTARMIRIAGDNQIAQANATAPVKAQVRVTDSFENAVWGEMIRVDVQKGGGKTDLGWTESDSLGMVSVAWTLGDPGDQELLIDAGLVSLTFHATSVASATSCVQQGELLRALESQLSSEGCSRNGKAFTIYRFNASGNTAWVFDMHSNAFDPYLELRDVNGRLIANNDNVHGSKDSRIRVWLDAGSYQLIAFSNSAGITGPFSLSWSETRPVPYECDALFVMKGLSISKDLVPLDCDSKSESVDRYRINLVAGEEIVVNLHDLVYSGYFITIEDENGTQLTRDMEGANYLNRVARFSADRDISLLVKIWSLDDYSKYDIEFQ